MIDNKENWVEGKGVHVTTPSGGYQIGRKQALEESATYLEREADRHDKAAKEAMESNRYDYDSETKMYRDEWALHRDDAEMLRRHAAALRKLI